METVDSVVYDSEGHTRFSLLLISVFAVIAALLAGVGLYGVISTSVRHRTSEIGIRMAMGAERGDILRLVVAQGLRLSVAGIVIGAIGSIFLGRVISALLVGGIKSTVVTDLRRHDRRVPDHFRARILATRPQASIFDP